MVSKMSSLAQKRVVVPVSSVGSPFTSGPVGDAHVEGLEPVEAVALDVDLDALGQRVDHRDADAVQTAGDLVAAAAELAAGVQHGEHDRDRGELLARRDVDRDAPAVVADLDAAVGHDRDLDAVAEAGQRLVDGVVNDLPHQVVQAALTGRADVHAGALADRLEPLQHLDGAGVVGARLHRVPFEDAGRDHVRSGGQVRGCFLGVDIGHWFRNRVGHCVGGLVGHEVPLLLCVRALGALERGVGGNTMAASRVGRRPSLSLPVSAPQSRVVPRFWGDPRPKPPLRGPEPARAARFRGASDSPYVRGGVQGPLEAPWTRVSRRCRVDRVP